MKRILVSIVATLAVLGLLGSASPAYAQFADNGLNEICSGATDSAVCDDKDTAQTGSSNSFYGQDGVIMKAARIVALAVGVASVIMIIIGGFKYVIANGDSNNINSAKNTILYAIIGLVISALAGAIIQFVLSRL